MLAVDHRNDFQNEVFRAFHLGPAHIFMMK